MASRPLTWFASALTAARTGWACGRPPRRTLRHAGLESWMAVTDTGIADKPANWIDPYNPRPRPMISFMISVVPPTIDRTVAGLLARDNGQGQRRELAAKQLAAQRPLGGERGSRPAVRDLP